MRKLAQGQKEATVAKAEEQEESSEDEAGEVAWWADQEGVGRP
jgi:hypothetical protein